MDADREQHFRQEANRALDWSVEQRKHGVCTTHGLMRRPVLAEMLGLDVWVCDGCDAELDRLIVEGLTRGR